jgi:predicted transcriptional regulator
MTFEPEITTFRTDRPGIRKVLGDLEAEIMELIWARPADQGTTVRDIFEILYDRRRLAYTTVMSTMSRLAKKHLLRVVKQDQTYIYYPNVSQQEFISRFVDRIIEDLLVNFTGETLSAFGKQGSSDSAEQARQMLDEITYLRKKEGE